MDDTEAREIPRAGDALELGWRVADLYALVGNIAEPAPDTLLPAQRELAAADQLELQLRTAAGYARRLGFVSEAEILNRLVPDAHDAPTSPDASERFRNKIRSLHVELIKALWNRDETLGKAYELGTGLSDTYSRILNAYRDRSQDLRADWETAFGHERVDNLLNLLDDLQPHLNPGGVAVVRNHLRIWMELVKVRLSAGGLPDMRNVRTWFRRQTLTWRRLLAADTELERLLPAYAQLDLMPEFRRRLHRQYRRYVLPALIVVLVAVGIVSLFDVENVFGPEVGALIVGVVGIVAARVALPEDVRARYHNLVRAKRS
jgi:hypothetical protein